MEKLDKVIFYTLEKAVKSYRQFAQRNTMNTGIDVTIDQWLVIDLLRKSFQFKIKYSAYQLHP